MGMTQSKDALCLKFAQVDGTASANSMDVSGIATEDTLVFVQGVSSNATAAPVDYTDYCTINAAGTIKSSTATTDYTLAVLWLDNSA